MINDEKEVISKMLNDMRKHLKYIEDTNWMFENNDGLLPIETMNNL